MDFKSELPADLRRLHHALAARASGGP
jgi:hypothetical protein